MIRRRQDTLAVRSALKRAAVVALLGPRQSGKTTLARQFVAAGSHNYFDLEDPQSLARLSEPVSPTVPSMAPASTSSPAAAVMEARWATRVWKPSPWSTMTRLP